MHKYLERNSLEFSELEVLEQVHKLRKQYLASPYGSIRGCGGMGRGLNSWLITARFAILFATKRPFNLWNAQVRAYHHAF